MNFDNNLSYEDKLLFNHVNDMIRLSDKYMQPRYSFFLDERQAYICDKYLLSIKYNDYIFYGGHCLAKRSILAVGTNKIYDFSTELFPLSILEINYNLNFRITHRDILGSIMALKIKREMIGDIICNDTNAYIFVNNKISDTIIEELTKIGRNTVTVNNYLGPEITVQQKYEEKNGTVSSMRVDCIISFLTGLSREKSSDLIKNIGVNINYSETKSISEQLKQNDILSIKGYGKYIVYSINGISKKGKLRITINKYI